MMYPNPNFLKYFPEVELPEEKDRSKRSSCLKIGAYTVIKKIIEDYKLDEMMKRIIGRDSGPFLDLAAYSIVTENNAGQYYPDYGYNHPLFTDKMRIYSDSKVSDFITSITSDQSIRQYKTYGTTIERTLYPSDEKNRYFHLFYSSQKHASEQEQLEAKIDRMQKNLKKVYGKVSEMDRSYTHYFKPIYYHEGEEDQILQLAQEKSEVIEEEIHLCGYFCIITSKKMSAKEALELYKSRDESEKLFKGDKSYLGNKAVRVQSDEAVEAKIFIEFVALVIRNKIYTSLKDAVLEDDSKANYMNVPAAIKELEKIEMIRQTDGEYRLDHAVTATQKTILKAFKMDAAYVQKEAGRIRTALKEEK